MRLSLQEITAIKESIALFDPDATETLTSRFARTADLIVNKVFRALEELIPSIDDIREVKELRNTIAHDYTESELEAVFKSVLTLTPELFLLAENIREHCKKF